MRREDMVLGAFILVPILCLIIPVPLFLLDLLFALNIALSMIILFNALFSKEPLDMSAFPTLLLLTTLFRLSLNVSSTRNILLKADAGNVVDTFGNFVGGGNLVVGAIVFFVLVIMQLLVINKGSERVSEVTARFTLDAMPGKQMAIDADLNTGAITDEEAKDSTGIGFLWFHGWCYKVRQGRCDGGLSNYGFELRWWYCDWCSDEWHGH